MASNGNTPMFSPDSILPSLGRMVSIIFERGEPDAPAVIRIDELLQEASSGAVDQYQTLIGGLAILHSIGILRVEEDRVQPSSRYAHFSLGSLSKFLTAGTSATGRLPNKEAEKYLISLTKELCKNNSAVFSKACKTLSKRPIRAI